MFYGKVSGKKLLLLPFSFLKDKLEDFGPISMMRASKSKLYKTAIPTYIHL